MAAFQLRCVPLGRHRRCSRARRRGPVVSSMRVDPSKKDSRRLLPLPRLRDPWSWLPRYSTTTPRGHHHALWSPAVTVPPSDGASSTRRWPHDRACRCVAAVATGRAREAAAVSIDAASTTTCGASAALRGPAAASIVAAAATRGSAAPRGAATASGGAASAPSGAAAASNSAAAASLGAAAASSGAAVSSGGAAVVSSSVAAASRDSAAASGIAVASARDAASPRGASASPSRTTATSRGATPPPSPPSSRRCRIRAAATAVVPLLPLSLARPRLLLCAPRDAARSSPHSLMPLPAR